ncbi:hypothetical protein [Deinococcus xinjiangensis]
MKVVMPTLKHQALWQADFRAKQVVRNTHAEDAGNITASRQARP